MESSIFKEYDIRGAYPKEINAKIAYKIAQGLVKFLKLKKGDKIVVGRDKRPSSPKIANAFMLGATDLGINVLDAGTIPTPMLYFAVSSFGIKGGAMITASHNTKNINGVKITREKAIPIGGLELESIVKNISIKKIKPQGNIRKINIKDKYDNEVHKNFKPKKKNSIPHSFDYDGDRLIVKDKKGKPIRGDIIGGIIGGAMAKKGDTIIYDIRCSHAIPRYFENKGIIAIPSRVGHFNIKKIMRERNAVFGMELTGHYYFKKFDYCESPLYALRKLTEHVNETGEKLAELTKPLLKYEYLTKDIKLFKKINFDKMTEKLKQKYSNGAINFTDGMTIEYSNWWFNIRQSNTEPLLRFTIEANNERILKERKEEILEIISSCNQ